MCDDDENEPASKKYQEQAEAVVDLFRRAPDNLIEEIEKLRFTYVVDNDEDAEEINEELTARPETDFQMALVSYLDGVDAPSESLLKLWREETRREDFPFPLWRRYFRSGNSQLKKLVLFGLDRYPTTHDLLENSLCPAFILADSERTAGALHVGVRFGRRSPEIPRVGSRF